MSSAPLSDVERAELRALMSTERARLVAQSAALRETFDERIGGAGRFRGPFQMMCFIDDHEIPVRRQQLRGAAWVAGKPVHFGNEGLFIVEGIARGIADLDRLAALFIEQGK